MATRQSNQKLQSDMVAPSGLGASSGQTAVAEAPPIAAAKAATDYGISATRALKNARAIAQHAAIAMPGVALPEILQRIPPSVLSSLHRSADPASLVADPQLREIVAGTTFASVNWSAAEPLFSGLLHFVKVTFAIKNQNNAVIAVSDADMHAIVAYATVASGPITAYAGQYGDGSLAISPNVISYSASLATSEYTDADVQQWVNQIAGTIAPAGAIAIVNPLGLVNTASPLSGGYNGYHGLANVPYVFLNLKGSGLTVADTNQYYATTLSHEMAEMTVDPAVDGSNPEVCDACGPNDQNIVIDYFKLDGTYLGSAQAPAQPSYPFDFQLNAIARPQSSASNPAPVSDCAYAPRGKPIAAGIPGTNILQLFARGSDAGVWSRWRNPDGNWSPQQAIGGKLTGGPIATVLPGTEILQLFYRGTDDGVWTRWRQPGVSGSWSAEQRLGGKVLGDIAAAVVPGTGILQLFYRGFDDAVWTRWREPGVNGNWTGEESLGGKIHGDPAVADIPGTDVLQLFYRGLDDSLWTRWRSPGVNGSWSAEQPLGGKLHSDPVPAVVPGTNVLQLFYRGLTNTLYTRWRDSATGTWSSEQNLAGALNSDPVPAVVPGTNILQVFYRGLDSAVWTRWRDPQSGNWLAEQSLGGHLNSDPVAAVVPGTDILQLFYRGFDGAVWTRWREPGVNGTWSAEQSLGG